MATTSLIISRDPEILSALCPLLHELEMGMELCMGLSGAIQIMRDRTFDAVIVDCDEGEAGLEFLRRLRMQCSHQKTIAVGIVSDASAMQATFDRGANFVLTKPLPVEDARRILRISKGMSMRAVRRFMRVPVETLEYITIDDRHEAFTLDLCQDGLAMQASELLARGQVIKISFRLPNTDTWVEGRAQVAWVDASGRAGVEFQELSEQHREQLNEWVFSKFRGHSGLN